VKKNPIQQKTSNSNANARDKDAGKTKVKRVYRAKQQATTTSAKHA
jgi:hypothetical protein